MLAIHSYIEENALTNTQISSGIDRIFLDEVLYLIKMLFEDDVKGVLFPRQVLV